MRRVTIGLTSLLLAGCSLPSEPIHACEYIGKQVGPHTYIVDYKELPCYDTRIDRVVRLKEER